MSSTETIADDLLPDVRVAQRYGVHPATIGRWDANPKLNFPKAVEINGRRYRYIRDLVMWERARVVARNKQTAA
jgi:hypothetical protein